jgi:hypothetical protein
MAWMLVLLLAACSPVGSLPVPTAAQATPVQISVPSTYTVSPLLTATTPATLEPPTPVKPTETAPVPTPSPLPPTLQLPPACTSWQEIDSAFVVDVELSDGTPLPPGLTVRKTWRIRNAGTCAWPEGMQLRHIAGVPLPGPQVVSLAHTAPGAEADVSISFETPKRLGKHESFWRLQTPDGHLVGAVLFVSFLVDANAEVPSTEMLEPPPSFTETPLPEAPAVPATPTLSPTATARPPTATRIPTMTPRPTSTPAPSPSPTTALPTLAPAVEGGDGCLATDPRFAALVELAAVHGLQGTCAVDLVQEEDGRVQVTWPSALIPDVVGATADGFMPDVPPESLNWVILAQNARKVWVLDSRDPSIPLIIFTAYQSHWLPTMPARSPTCDILVPPAGAVFPTEAIGAVWCAESLWLTIGWPVAPPLAAQLAVQEMEAGLFVEVRAGGSRYLIAMDYEQRRAIVHQVP